VTSTSPNPDTPNAVASTEDFEFAALWEARNYRNAIVEEFREHLRGEVIEVGCGIGQMSMEFLALKEVSKLTCIEPDSRFAEQHRQMISGAALIEGTAADLPVGFSADAIVSINVLEHIREDVAELAMYRELLAARSGHLCLLVPARPELYSPLDADFGHFRRYTRGELRSKIEGAGFRVVKLHYFNSIGYLAWLLSFKMMRKRSFDIKQVRFYDRVIFPVMNRIERSLVRPPLGQSLVVIAKAV